MTTDLVVGLDLGGTKTAAGVVTSQGMLLSNVRMPTPRQGVRRDLAALFDAAHAAVGASRVTWREIVAIGVGVPGAFDPRSQTVWAPNLPGWRKVALGRLMQLTLRRPTFVEGDRNVQALAEMWLGAGAQASVRSLVFLTMGTGIGAGLISDGRLITGAHGVAGAVGWMVIDRAWKVEYKRRGCLETLGAGPAVAKLGRLAARRATRGSLLARRKGGRITAETVAAAARRGDKVAREVLAEVGMNLGMCVANIVSLLNPDMS